MYKTLKDNDGELVRFAGKPIRLICHDATKARLAATCFRGSGRPLAGNFRRWESIEEMLEDGEVGADCAVDLLEALNELNEDYRMSGYRSDTFWYESECVTSVGWSSTIPLVDAPDDLEEFKLDRQAWGLRVRRTEGGLLAPLTRVYTLQYEVRYESQNWAVIINGAYPGPYAGEIEGDVSRREGIAFLHLRHPGVGPENQGPNDRKNGRKVASVAC